MASLQARFDDKIAELVKVLDDAYPAGDCPDHSTIQCFLNSTTKHHYELDCIKKLVWAAAIVSCPSIAFTFINTKNMQQHNNKATVSLPPLASPHFLTAKALKNVVSSGSSHSVTSSFSLTPSF